MNNTPFTVSADLDLGARVAPYLCGQGADVVIAEGEVPANLNNSATEDASYQISGDRFLLKVPQGASILVEGGNQITYARNGASDLNVALFLLGSAWGALCYQRDLLPVHASAIINEGKVHAFTGPSGAGAALRKRASAASGRAVPDSS